MHRKMKSGYTWHMFHNQLLTYCCDYDYRVRTIKRNKPKYEMPDRLKRFQFVKGKLPEAFTQYDLGPLKMHSLVRDHQAAVEALHKKECKNCSWDGVTLVELTASWLRGRNWYNRLWRWLRVKWYSKPNWASHGWYWPWNRE